MSSSSARNWRYWIQRHDYSSEEFDAASAQIVVDAFEAFDWSSEVKLAEAGEDDRDCPPGLGLHDGFGDHNDATLVHICPQADGTLTVNAHWPVPGKILGLFNVTKREVHFSEGIARDQVFRLIEPMFVGRPERIREL